MEKLQITGSKMSTAEMESNFEEKTEDSPLVKSLNDQIISQVGKDYSEYLTINASNERQQFDDSIEGMLTRLDEYLGLVSLIRSDTNLCLETTLPVVQEKSEQLTKIFDRIDRLEAFVAVVKQNMDVTEENLNRAEAELGSVNSLRKMFTNISMPSFLSKNKPPRQPTTRPSASKKFNPPEIFKTSDYLHYNTDGEQAAASSGVKTQSVTKTQPETQTLTVTPSGEDSGTWPAIGDM